MRIFLVPIAMAAAAGLAAAAHAAGERPGRYTMSPADGGGFVRLDTETGQMSLCQRRDNDWACRDMADPTAGLSQEVERLRAENQRLKTEMRQMEDIMLGDKHAEGKREFKLPSEQDVDNAMTYVQRMLRKFREKLKEMESEKQGDATLTSSRPDPTTPLAQAIGRLQVDTPGEGLVEVTRQVAGWLGANRCRDGLLTLFLRHTSASLTIQENADPDVPRDLVTALRRLAPEDAGWVHAAEGPDDMPAHVRTMLTGVNLAIPVTGGRLTLGTWQGIHVVEHRARPHRREVVLHFLGTVG